MSTLELFTHETFGSVRTLEVDGKITFCGKDVATALGYNNPADALTRHCKGVVKRYPLETDGGTQQVRFITEGDLYRLITHSKLPTAQTFETWIFDDVLPTIRKHGAYLTPEATEAALTDPDFIIRLATELKNERAKTAQLAEEAAANQPKVLFADAVATSTNTILIGDLAKILRGNGIQIGANRLFQWMRDNGFLIRRQGSDYNSPTQRAMELGLFRVKETAITHSDGHVTVTRTPKVTGKGQQYFVERFLAELPGDEVAARRAVA